MTPEILRLGPFVIRGYGLSIAIGMILALALSFREAKRTNSKALEQRILPLFFAVVLAATVGGKLFFILLHSDEWKAARGQGKGGLLGEGFVFYGALIFAVSSGTALIRAWKLPVLRTLDLLIPVAPLAHGFGRLGCFLAGCCFGCETTLPWGVSFPDGHALPGRLLHPVQIYEALGNFLIFSILWLGPRRYGRSAGRMILSYVLLYSVLRFVTESFRGDGNPVWIGSKDSWVLGNAPSGITTGQVTSIVLFVAGLTGFWLLRHRRRGASKKP